MSVPTERAKVLALANRLLDMRYADPDDDLLTLARHLTRLHSEREWRPIKTAPKSGISILVYQPWKSGYNCVLIAHYANGWINQAACDRCGVAELEPTHWMPLPEGP